MSSPPPSPPLPEAGENPSSPSSRPVASSPAQPQQQQHVNAGSPSQSASPQGPSNGARNGRANGTRSSWYGDNDSPPGSPMSGLDDDGGGSPMRSAPPTPLSSFSPHGYSGSLPRTPSSAGRRSLPGTPRTPFTPIDMQVCCMLLSCCVIGREGANETNAVFSSCRVLG